MTRKENKKVKVKLECFYTGVNASISLTLIMIDHDNKVFFPPFKRWAPLEVISRRCPDLSPMFLSWGEAFEQQG